MKVFTAEISDSGKRLDQWLAECFAPEISRSRLKTLIQEGSVTLNTITVTEPKRKIAEGDVVRLSVPEPVAAEPEGQAIALDILYEDDDVIVINKPSGLVVHPGAGNHDGTLVNALIHHCGDTLSGIGGVKRPGIVHRLDKDTSGVMVVAKHDNAHKHLSAQFADHGRTGALKRVYRALVWGGPTTVTGTVENHLGRSSSDRTKQAIVSDTQPDARHAVTHYRVVERFGSQDGSNAVASLIDCSLETGRTHQIRIHMASLGLPLIGDGVYGAGYKTKANTLPDDLRQTVLAFNRQALHARVLAFEHPAIGEVMEFTAPEPQDMAELISGFTTV